MASNLFSAKLAQFAQEAPEKALRVVKKVAEDISSRVVLRTPVGNPSLWKSKPPAGYVGGRLRANWNVGIGGINRAERGPDKGGIDTTRRNSRVIALAKEGQDIYITNSLPYANRVEYEGWSRQAPAGMLRITLAEFPGLVIQAVNEVKNESATR